VVCDANCRGATRVIVSPTAVSCQLVAEQVAAATRAGVMLGLAFVVVDVYTPCKSGTLRSGGQLTFAGN
jgi:hypothetical protein